MNNMNKKERLQGNIKTQNNIITVIFFIITLFIFKNSKISIYQL